MAECGGVDLAPIARQQRQIITDLGTLREDMAVLTAIVLRQDSTLTALLTEVRAMLPQHGRLADRVSALDEPARGAGARRLAGRGAATATRPCAAPAGRCG
jgi:hypothetical protein